MANELRVVSDQTTSGNYAIIHRTSDGKVWNPNTTAWVTFPANIDDIDIVLSDFGGDVLAADFPTDIDAGTEVVVVYYDQIGGSPTVNDTILASETRTWDGVSLAGAGSVSLDAYALTTLESLKRHAGVTTTADDDLLKQIINGVSARIERETGRKFAARDYTERVNAVPGRKLSVTQFPLIEVTRVAWGEDDALRVTYTGSDILATVSVTNSAVRLVSHDAAGSQTENALTFASNASAGALKTAIDAVSGWSATLVQNTLSKYLNPVAGQDALNRNVDLTYAEDDECDISVEYDSGLIQWTPRLSGWWDGVSNGHPFQNVLVDYRAGYETIPNDIELVANELAAQAYRVADQNTALASESLGGYAYTLANGLQIDESMRSKLLPYQQTHVGGV